MEKKLDNLAKRTGKTKSFYVRQALEENFEDMEDIKLADKIWEGVLAGDPLYTHEEIKSMLRMK
jgi:RHH-type rel operon transcriptional repressor/antitoxin RelB